MPNSNTVLWVLYYGYVHFEFVAGRCVRFWYNVENPVDRLTVKLYNGKFLPPATKLGQGNIFSSVCQEFCPQLVAATDTYGWQAGGTHPTGMLSC